MEYETDVNSDCEVDVINVDNDELNAVREEMDIVNCEEDMMEIDEFETNIEKSSVDIDKHVDQNANNKRSHSKLPLREVKILLDRSSIDVYYRKKREMNNNDTSLKLNVKGAGKQMSILNFFKKADSAVANNSNKENEDQGSLNKDYTSKRQLRGKKMITKYMESDTNSESEDERNKSEPHNSSKSIFECNKKSTNMLSMTRESDHTKFFKLYCSNCDKNFERILKGGRSNAAKFNSNFNHCPNCKKLLVFQCIECKKVYKHYDSTYIHRKKCNKKSTTMQSKTTKPDYQKLIKLYCNNCDKNYERALQGGRLSATEYIKNLTHCPDCGKSLTFQCSKCKKCYKHYNSTYTHVKTTCERQLYLKCEKCDYVAYSKDLLKLHVTSVHTIVDRKDYIKCTKCGKEFKNQRSIKRHLQRNFSCSGGKIHSCTLCSFKSKSRDWLREHLKSHKTHAKGIDTTLDVNKESDLITHSLEETISVDNCVTGHVRLIDPQPYQQREPEISKHVVHWCKKCEIETDIITTQQLINCHKCKKPMLYKCKQCAALYNHTSGCYYHLKSKCNGKPKYYNCDHCNKKFMKKWTLREHIIGIHMNCVKEINGFFKCTICCKQYTAEKRFKDHLNYCGKPKLFKCRMCNYKSIMKGDLKKHFKRVHKYISKEKVEIFLDKAEVEVKKAKGRKIKRKKVEEKPVQMQNDAAIDDFETTNIVNTDTSWLCKEEIKKAWPFMEIYCPKCGNTQKGKHIAPKKCIKCKEKNRFRCLKCSKDWTAYGGLVYHVKVEHLLGLEQRKLYQCGKCFHRFNFYNELKRHWKKTCVNTDALECDHCKYVTKHKSSLVNHISLMHMGLRKNLTCEKCKNKFYDAEELGQHQKEDCRNKYYWCDDCGKRFKYKSGLLDHIKSAEMS